ncbi:hypothetical protein L1987_39827 [Smallanthus sonchifolius]|uniref:Uncharacterized protein n=1 Tax=Smallanthus sonchifolius TaxID=185202 RepID=A0ACB9GTB8_9ASTR|nr:hypothetical protein L1987_39827 [Smallanthus sonchifolius]
MDLVNSWKWAPANWELNEIDPVEFMGVMRDRRIGDSLNENFVVSSLCILRVAKKWKRNPNLISSCGFVSKIRVAAKSI